jgi:hypothetical protein
VHPELLTRKSGRRSPERIESIAHNSRANNKHAFSARVKPTHTRTGESGFELFAGAFDGTGANGKAISVLGLIRQISPRQGLGKAPDFPLKTKGFASVCTRQWLCRYRLGGQGRRGVRRLLFVFLYRSRSRKARRGRWTLWNSPGRMQRLYELDGYIPVPVLAEHLGVSQNWVGRCIYNGQIDLQHVTRRQLFNNYQIQDDPRLMDHLQQFVELHCT